MAVEFQDVRMSIDFIENGDFVFDVTRTPGMFDSDVNLITCSQFFFPLSNVHTTVSAVTEKTIAPFLRPTDFKDFFYGLYFTTSRTFSIERLRKALSV